MQVFFCAVLFIVHIIVELDCTRRGYVLMLDLKGIGFSTFDNHIAMDKDVLLRECGRLISHWHAIVEFIVKEVKSESKRDECDRSDQ